MANLEDVIGADGWKVRINRLPYMDRVDFFMYRVVNGRSELLTPTGVRYITDGMPMYDGDIQPILSLSNMNAKAVMVALAEAISEEGVRTPDSHRLQGMLDAQAAHLEDLRTLLKLNKHRGIKQ